MKSYFVTNDLCLRLLFLFRKIKIAVKYLVVDFNELSFLIIYMGALRRTATTFLFLSFLYLQAHAQSCGWVDIQRVHDQIRDNLYAAPNFSGCNPEKGYFFGSYFVPGSRNFHFSLGLGPSLYYGNFILQGAPPNPDGAWIQVLRFNKNVNDYEVVFTSENLVLYPGAQISGCINLQGQFGEGFNYPFFPSVLALNVQGEDIVSVQFYSSGCVQEHSTGIGFVHGAALNTTCLGVGASSDIKFDLRAIPMPDPEYPDDDDYVSAYMTIPEMFSFPGWDLLTPNGCSLYSNPVGDWAVDIRASAGSVAGSSCTLKCFEALVFNNSAPVDWIYGVSGSYITKSLEVLPPPRNEGLGIPFAGGHVHHQIELYSTSPGVYNGIVWSLVGDSMGCSIAPKSGDPNRAILTLGNLPSSGSTKATIIVRAKDTIAEFDKQSFIDIYPEPTIMVDRGLYPGRTAYVYANYPGAFSHVTWSISSRSGAADCTISQQYVGSQYGNTYNQVVGVIKAGNATGTVTVRATDTDGYYVEQVVTVNAKPTLAVYAVSGPSYYYPACLVAGYEDLILSPIYETFEMIDFAPGVTEFYADSSNLQIVSGPVNCEIFELGYFNSSFSGFAGIYPGDISGSVTVKYTNPWDGWSFTQTFVVRPAPVLSYPNLLNGNILGAWGGSSGMPQLSGSFGTVEWHLYTPYGTGASFEDNPPLPPSASINASGVITSGAGWSELPYNIPVLAKDPGVVNYGVWDTLAVRPLRPPNPLTDGPAPYVGFSSSIVPTGGSLKTIAKVVHYEQMNGPAWLPPVATPPGALQSSVVNNDGTLTITPGNIPGTITVVAQDTLVGGYVAAGTIRVDQAQITFAPATILVADGASHTIAGMSDTLLFDSVSWQALVGGIPISSAILQLTPQSATTCLLSAGNTVQNTIAIRATCNNNSPNKGYYVDNYIDIHAVPVVLFSKEYLISGATATTRTSDDIVFPPASTVWTLVSAPSGVTMSGNAISVPSGVSSGKIIVKAQSANDTRQGSINIQAFPTLTFDPPSLAAGSPLHAQVKLSFGTVASCSIADPSGTGTTIDSTGTITAGKKSGTVAITVTDNNGYQATGNFMVTMPRSVAFNKNPLLADGQASGWASVQPAGSLGQNVAWSIRGQTLGCAIVPGTGQILTGRLPGNIIVRATDSSTGDFVEGILKLKSDCLTSCSSGLCVGGGGSVNNNSVDVNISLGYVDYGQTEVSVGFEANTPSAALVTPQMLSVANGNSQDVELIPATGTLQQVKTPTMLAVVQVDSSAQYHVNLYSIDQISLQTHASGSPYVLNAGATPFCVWTIANPTQGDYNHVNVTETRGSQSYVANYTYRTDLGAGVGNGWDMVVDGGTRKERRTKTSYANDNIETYTILDVAASDAVRYKEVRTYHVYPWNNAQNPEEITSLTVGTGPTALTTSWFYYTDAADLANYGKISKVLLPGGAWETYRYDTFGRKVSVVSQFLDNPVPTTTAEENNNRVTVTAYDDVNNIADEKVLLQGTEISHKYTKTVNSVNGSDAAVFVTQCQNRGVTSIAAPAPVTLNVAGYTYTGGAGPSTPASVSVATLPGYVYTITAGNSEVGGTLVNGTQQLSLTPQNLYTVIAQGNFLTFQIQSRGNGVSLTATLVKIDPAIGNLTTANYTFPSGLPHLTTRPDGTIVLYSYSVASGLQTKTIKEGQPNGDNTDVVAGIKTVTVYDQAGNVVSDQQFDIVNSSLPLSSKVRTAQDGFGRPLAYSYGDGSSESMTYNCCGMDTLTDRQGVTTSYTYDNLKRPGLVTKAGLSTRSQYNVIGKIATVTRITPNGGSSANTVVNSYLYDNAGRLTSATDLIGPTTIGFSTDGNGHQVVTTTYPNQSTKVETYYKDGSRFSVGGTAVYPSTFQYGADSDGAYKTEIRVRGASNSEWVKGSLDLLGRQFKVSYPLNAAGQMPYSQYYYSQTTGQLWKSRNLDGVVTLYSYNPRGELFQSAVDMDRNDLISTAVDRVQEFSTSVQPNAGNSAMLQVKHHYVWDQPATGGPVQTETLTTTTAVDGSYQQTSSFGQNDTTVVTYTPGSQARTETETFRDNTQRISVYVNDRLASVTQMDAAATRNQLSRTTYQYYTDGIHFGKLQSTTDARNGTTSYTYNAAGQIESLTTPTPGLGQTSPLVTQYAYDELNVLGRVETTTLPDLSTRTQTYQLTGEKNLGTGSGIIPTQYTYEQGRVKTIKTWRTYGNESTAEITTFNYSADRGFLTSKTYAGSAGPTYTYYDSGLVKTRTWSGGAIKTSTYNNAGDLWQETYSDATPGVTYTYNARGQNQTVMDSAGTCTTEYYVNGLPHTETYSGGSLNGVVKEYNYDSLLRRQTTIVRNNGTEIYRQGNIYNPNDSRLRDVIFEGVLAQFQYEDNASLVKTVALKRGATESGATILMETRQHNFLNQLAAMSTVGSDATTSFSSLFNSLGQRRRVTGQDGSYWIYTYDEHGQLATAKRYWSDNTLVAGQQFSYNFDDVGNRTSTLAGGDGSGINLRSASYTPDVTGNNQYAMRDVPHYIDIMGSASPLATVTVTGDSIYQTVRKGDYFWAQVPVVNTYGQSERANVIQNLSVQATRWDYAQGRDVLTAITKEVSLPPGPQNFIYDSVGNLKDDSDWTYTWDAENRLVSMERYFGGVNQNFSYEVTRPYYTKISFSYDYLGRRIEKDILYNYGGLGMVINYSIRYVYDGWNLLAELDVNGVVQHSYAWGASDDSVVDNEDSAVPLLVKSHQATDELFYVAQDCQGSVAALFNVVDGKQATINDYGPFGEPLRHSSVAAAPMAPFGFSMAGACPFGFAGKYTDAETGLIYYGKRYFSPTLGRWLSRDPIEEAGGANLYGFVGNDPINRRDLLGLIWGDESSSFVISYLGRSLDPRSYYQNAVSGDSFDTASSYSYHVLMVPVQLGRSAIHPLQTGQALLALPGMISSGQLKCLLREKYDEYLRASPQEQMEILGGIIGDNAGGWATGAGAAKLAGLAKSALFQDSSTLAAKITTVPGAQGSFTASEFGDAIANNPIASRAYGILQNQGVDVSLYRGADNFAGSAGNGFVNINLEYNATVDDALSTLIHEAKHIDLEANTGKLYGLRGTASGEYSARALEFFFQNGRRPNALERQAIQQEINSLGY